MEESIAIAKLIEYINQQVLFYKEKIDVFEISGSNKEKYKQKIELNFYKSELNDYKNLLYILNNRNKKVWFKSYNEKLNILFKSPLTISEKTECICFLFNINYNFFINDNNLKIFYENQSRFDNLKDAKNNFKYVQSLYSNLKILFLNNNRVNGIKQPNDEMYPAFSRINMPECIADMIIDTSMRNYMHKFTK